MKQTVSAETLDSAWKGLFKIGGVAALIAGVIFRRNLGAELSLFCAQKQPDTVIDWFTLLQENKLLGLAYLNIFDLVNYALVGVIFLALYAVLKRTNKSHMAIAMPVGLIGIAVYFASNTAFSMLALSDQYAAAMTDAQKNTLLAAGQALLALNRFSNPGAHPGTGGYMSLLLIAVAGLITSIVMLKSEVFNRATAYVGILASALDLIYCIAFAFVPGIDGDLLAVCLIPAAGLLVTIWHIMAGRRLFQLGSNASKKG